MPKSFKKDSFQSVFSDNFHLEKCIDLPENCFLVNNTPYNVPCVFQIWVKKIQPRVKTEIKVPVVIRYVNKNEHPDLSFRRVGVNAGDISKEIETKSSQSHYFLKILNSISIDDFINIYNTNKNFIFNNTVGPKSISKSELNSYINSIEEKLVR